MFALGLAGIGVQHLVRADFVAALLPVPRWVPARPVLAVLAGVVVLAACAAIALDRRRRTAARVLLALLGFSAICLHAPILVTHLRSGPAWTAAFEAVALAGAAALLALPTTRAGRLGLGASLPVFGVLHFVYRDYCASVVPAWIPWHMFWALATGVAHIAAGLAFLSDRHTRLAATLATVMFGSWAALLHVPRVIATPHAPEWTSLFICTAMCGGCWLLAAAARRAA